MRFYTRRFTVCFDERLYQRLRQVAGHRGLSATVRKAVALMLAEEERRAVQSGDWRRVLEELGTSPSLQVVGDVGIGKTYTVQQLVRNDRGRVYAVLDAHDEYTFLPARETLSQRAAMSYRVRLPRQEAAAKGLFPLFVNQILSRRWPDNYVVVVEEAHRYKELVKGLLAESRKFVKVLTVSPEPIASFVPAVRIVPRAARGYR